VVGLCGTQRKFCRRLATPGTVHVIPPTKRQAPPKAGSRVVTREILATTGKRREARTIWVIPFSYNQPMMRLVGLTNRRPRPLLFVHTL
jgi:hypothetical protein